MLSTVVSEDSTNIPHYQSSNWLVSNLARGIFYAVIAIVDPSILRAIRVWHGLHSTTMSSVSDDNYDFTVGGGIINVQTEIIRFVEELGIYDAERKPSASTPLAPPTPAYSRPGQFDVPGRRIETDVEDGSGPAFPPPPLQQQREDQDEQRVEDGGRKGSSTEATEEARQRQKRVCTARLAAEKLVKRQI